MKVISDVPSWRQLRGEIAGSVGFVPTMGALHEGHISLLRRSLATDDVTVLSIYVNPTQFNIADDLHDYPSSLDEDLSIARELGVHFVLLPSYAEIYADGYRYQIVENELSQELCGANRPGHFTGVLTVVMKLLNIVKPQRAYFGKKDFQQYRLVQQMCDAFFMDVQIVGCTTIRECDGLAMSSRNKLLTPAARRLARKFYAALATADDDGQVAVRLASYGFTVDYVVTQAGRRFGAINVAVDDGEVRLIDNVERLPDAARSQRGEAINGVA